jgi:hypothetical protein
MLCQRIIFDRGPGEILGFIIGAIVQCFIEKFSIKKPPKSSATFGLIFCCNFVILPHPC